MVSRFLVTTALEKTWPDNPETHTLFLGEWCRLYSRRERWSNMNAEVMPYHWDDREKLHRDYLYLRDFYEQLISLAGAKMNQIHQVDYSTHYWRILIGEWLGYFIQMLFERWTMLKGAIAESEIEKIKVFKVDPKRGIPNDMSHFIRLFAEDH